MDRPNFSLETQARIEQARHDIFKNAESEFDMLFFPLMQGLIGSIDFSRISTVPVQKKPATLRLQLSKYTRLLFDAEAEHYLGLKPTTEQLTLWLGDLAERTNHEVRNIAQDARNDIHCGLQERLNAVTDELASRAQWWLQAKQRADSKALVSRAPRPINVGLARELQALPSIATEIAKYFGNPAEPSALPPPRKSVEEMLDDIALNEDISQEELALRIGLSRSVYFLAKKGKGSKRARKKLDLYLSKRSEPKQD